MPVTKIPGNGLLILDEDLIMTIFLEIVDEVEPFDKYLHLMFKEKASNLVGTRAKEDKVKPYRLLHEELFYPTRKDIQQTYNLTCQLACEAATVFLIKFRDPTKATNEYFSSMSGPKSWSNASDQTKLMLLNVSASKSVSEANHATSTVCLKLSGTIPLDHVCAEG